MKFSKNTLAPLSITVSFLSLSIFLPLFAVYALFRPEEFLLSLSVTLLVILLVLMINVIAETVAYCRRNRASVTITLNDDKLTLEYRRKTKVKRFNVEYSDINHIELDIGYIPGKYSRRRGRKAVEPSMELTGIDGASFLNISCPSLLMIYHLKKKCPHAKISPTVFIKLLLPTAFTVLLILLFAIAN